MPRLSLTDVPKDNSITATFEIVTPMFLGDAEQKATAIRPTAIKGALRFWWRALNGHMSSTELAKEEARLFGSTDGGGVFSLAITESKIEKNDPNHAGEKEPAISVQKFGALHYSLGQGLTAVRNAIMKGNFTLNLFFHEKTSLIDRQQIEQTIQVFGILGSLGSRARHGWGSVSITAVKGAETIRIPTTEAEYQNILKQVMTGKTNSLPEFTAFSTKTRIDLALKGKDALNLLTKSSSELQMYRSFGNNGKVGGRDAERNFKADHDLVLEHIQGRQADIAPKRVVFGLPHNYFFSNGKGKADVNAKVGNEETRRGSPLLTHIQKIGDSYLLVHALFPSVFLPDNAKITIKGGKAPTAQIPPKVDYTVITQFMDRFQGATKVLPQ